MIVFDLAYAIPADFLEKVRDFSSRISAWKWRMKFMDPFWLKEIQAFSSRSEGEFLLAIQNFWFAGYRNSKILVLQELAIQNFWFAGYRNSKILVLQELAIQNFWAYALREHKPFVNETFEGLTKIKFVE